MDEARLIERLRLIEALYAGAATEGERVAAGRARERILDHLEQLAREEPPLEYRFSMADMWSRKVFVALLRRYGIRPYRYRGQRYTTVMAKVSRRFVDETLWPEFQEISKTLESYLADVTDRVVQQVLHADSSEAEVVDKGQGLPSDRTSTDRRNDAPPPDSNPASAAEAAPSGGTSAGRARAGAQSPNGPVENTGRQSTGPKKPGAESPGSKKTGAKRPGTKRTGKKKNKKKRKRRK